MTTPTPKELFAKERKPKVVRYSLPVHLSHKPLSRDELLLKLKDDLRKECEK